MTDYLLDTNILIFHFRNQPEAVAWLTQPESDRTLFIAVVTRTEILAGMRPHEEHVTLNLLASLNNLPIDEPVADQAGRLIYHYARQGIQLSFPDAQIAATALYYNLTLVTTNTKHFPMPELKLYLPWEN